MHAVFCGHDFLIGCLEAMLEEGLDVVALFSVRPTHHRLSTSALQRIARQNRIRVEFGRITPAHLREFAGRDVELIVSAAYPYKIPAGGGPIARGLNVHTSLLPEGRGAWPLPTAIDTGLTRTGVTVHKLAERLDAGDILAREVVAVGERETLESLSCKVQISAKALLARTLRDLDHCWVEATPQAAGSYWKTPTWEDRTIRWDRGVAEIDRLVRAFGKAGTLGRWNGREWLVEDVSVWEDSRACEPGSVVHRAAGGMVVVAAADGLVCVRSFRSRLRRRLEVALRLAGSYLRSVLAIGGF